MVIEDHEYPDGLGDPIAVFSTRQGGEQYIVRLESVKGKGTFVARAWRIFELPYDPPASQSLAVAKWN